MGRPGTAAEMICKTPGCPKTNIRGRGLCNDCFEADPAPAPKERRPVERPLPTCRLPGCPRTDIVGHGLCNPHYLRHLRHGDPLAGSTFKGDPMRFLDQPFDEGRCRIWPYSVDGKGIPQMHQGTTSVGPARIVARRHLGRDLQRGEKIVRVCGVKRCLNPRHMRVGSHGQMMAIMAETGRTARGERNGRAKLTEEDVHAIHHTAHNYQMSHGELAHTYGVCRSQISNILAGRSWRHIWEQVR